MPINTFKERKRKPQLDLLVSTKRDWEVVALWFQFLFLQPSFGQRSNHVLHKTARDLGQQVFTLEERLLSATCWRQTNLANPLLTWPFLSFDTPPCKRRDPEDDKTGLEGTEREKLHLMEGKFRDALMLLLQLRNKVTPPPPRPPPPRPLPPSDRCVACCHRGIIDFVAIALI